jgi:hypothetical protein
MLGAGMPFFFGGERRLNRRGADAFNVIDASLLRRRSFRRFA